MSASGRSALAASRLQCRRGLRLGAREHGPFPSDRFTVPNMAQNTAVVSTSPRRRNCVANQSECDELGVINQLDDFDEHTRFKQQMLDAEHAARIAVSM
jgi:hypothetical protein